MQISHVGFSGSNRDHRRSIAFYVDLIIQILKFRNVNVTHECICLQLDTPGSFELIKNNLFLILMSIFFSSNHSKIKTTRAFMLHHTAVCSVYAYT